MFRRKFRIPMVLIAVVMPIVITANEMPFPEAPRPIFSNYIQGIFSTAFTLPQEDATSLQKDPSKAEQAPENLSRDEVLLDPLARISDTFTITEDFKLRVRFWLDIYTRFNSDTYLIHNIQYPWIVYEIVDPHRIESVKHRNRFTQHYRAEKYVKNRLETIRKDLKKLGRTREKDLTEDQRVYLAQLKAIPGFKHKHLLSAHSNIRIQEGQRNHFLKSMDRGLKYLPFLEKEFYSLGLPLELTRLPMVESSFDLTAESKVGAKGIWQIMPQSAEFYLRMDGQVDERMSPFKSTIVAADLFRRNLQTFKTWPLAVTAYNVGIGNLRKAIETYKSNELSVLIQMSHKRAKVGAPERGAFRFASGNFYACFLAALYAEKYKEYLFEKIELSNAKLPPFLSHEMNGRVPLKSFLKKNKISTDDFLALNPDLRLTHKKNGSIPSGLIVFLPSDSSVFSASRLKLKKQSKNTFRKRLAGIRNDDQTTQSLKN